MARADGAGEMGRVMDALRRIVRALRVASRAVERDYGVSGAQLFVLRQIASAPRQSLSDLVARTHTHQSSVSEVVARLVDRGLVARRAAADDARRAELRLTPKGTALMDAAPRTVQANLIEGFAQLTAAQRRALADGLTAWIETSGLGGVEPSMFFEGARPDAARGAPAGAKGRRSTPSARRKTASAVARGSEERGARRSTSVER